MDTNSGRTTNSSLSYKSIDSSYGNNFKRKTLIQLFDEALSRDNYTLKNPSASVREYMVDKFNRAFNNEYNLCVF
ncbi:hypothetical protein YC2023_099158 [Brassica napus]